MADGDINEERMRLIGRRLAGLSMVSQVDPFPRDKPDRVVCWFGSSYYPDHVDSARLEFRLQLDGRFNFQYIESWSGNRWACRWDRHPNPHNSKDHFHIPPRVRERNAVDAQYPDDLDKVIQIVLETIEERTNQLWTEATTPVYPDAYNFQGEYGQKYLNL